MNPLHMDDLNWRVVAAFWSHVDVRPNLDDCWEWNGSLDRAGYGNVRIHKKLRRSHRVAFALSRGRDLSPGMVIDHLCRNTRCVNPRHLDEVTTQENVLRGIGPTAERARQTHCYQGHPLSGENLKITSRGYRQCKTCRQEHDLLLRAAAAHLGMSTRDYYRRYGKGREAAERVLAGEL